MHMTEKKKPLMPARRGAAMMLLTVLVLFIPIIIYFPLGFWPRFWQAYTSWCKPRSIS